MTRLVRSTLLSSAVVVVALATRPAAAAVEFVERVEMSDGVGLSTLVVLPNASGGPWPTIVTRKPYTGWGPNGDLVEQGFELLALIGVATVVQDTRGFGASEGQRVPFLWDRQDGLETLDWILRQPWCDGRIMFAGASALAIPGYLLAPDAPSQMICQTLALATPDLYTAVFHGGVFEAELVDTFSRWVDAPDTVAALHDHVFCDDYWSELRLQDRGAAVRAPAVHLVGWFDPFTEGTIAGFQMYRQSADPFVAAHQYLIVGPWTHHALGEQDAGEFTFPGNARFDYLAELLHWLRWCFDDVPGPVATWAPVRYYVMGDVEDPAAPGNEWRTADAWPPEAVPTRLPLTAAGGLGGPPDAFESTVVFPFDPADPSPTVGGPNLGLTRGPRNMAPVESRADAAVFTTAPLDEPVEATGRPRVHLVVQTSGPDADFAVRLTDVFPDGRSFGITEGIVRLSRREGCAATSAVTPDTWLDVEFDLLTTSYIFNRGHRIRLIVTGSNAPRYEPNPTVVLAGGPITLRLRTGGVDDASWLELPVPVPPLPPPENVEEVAGERQPEATAEPGPEPGPEPTVEVVEWAPDAGGAEIAGPDGLGDAPSPPDGGGDVAVAPPDGSSADAGLADAADDAGPAPSDAPGPDAAPPDAPAPEAASDARPGADAKPEAGVGHELRPDARTDQATLADGPAAPAPDAGHDPGRGSSGGGCTGGGANAGWPLATLLLAAWCRPRGPRQRRPEPHA